MKTKTKMATRMVEIKMMTGTGKKQQKRIEQKDKKEMKKLNRKK